MSQCVFTVWAMVPCRSTWNSNHAGSAPFSSMRPHGRVVTQVVRLESKEQSLHEMASLLCLEALTGMLTVTSF